jgi:uncharacterized membrane protein (UPF0127 family)
VKQVKVNINGRDLDLQVAKSLEQQRTGLMNRTFLDTNSGMIFVYDREKYVSFWMKNTEIPLSIAFIDKNDTITQIEDMNPGELSRVKSEKPSKYAIEVNLGWFDQNKITVGDKVDMSNLQNKKRINLKIKKKKTI